MAGQVRVDGGRVDKPGAAVAAGARIELSEGRRFVSRGGEKLANALDALQVDVADADALDVGASTGGFTDCLLQRGAARVIALDVGYGQLDWGLRNDSRVHVAERTNARELTPGDLPWPPDLVTVDVSFIGARVVWPAIAACLPETWRALIMVKPQFELERDDVGSGGVVRDPARRLEAVLRVAAAVEATGGGVRGVADSGLPGPKGNREIFILAGPGPGIDADALMRVARSAVDAPEVSG